MKFVDGAGDGDSFDSGPKFKSIPMVVVFGRFDLIRFLANQKLLFFFLLFISNKTLSDKYEQN